MEGPGRVSNKLSLRLSDHLLPSIPQSDFNLGLRTYRSLYLEPSSKPSHSPSLRTHVSAPTPDLKETQVALSRSLKSACYFPF